MSDILIRNALGLEGRRWSVRMDDGRITAVHEGSVRGRGTDIVIDAKDLLVMPGLCNSHTHAPMSLLRGVGEDMELMDWLRDRIWPLEAKMREEHLIAGMELGCLEMIKTGTTLFNDMYFKEGRTASAVSSTGLRACLGEGFIDMFDEDMREIAIKGSTEALKEIDGLGDPRIKGALAPHAVYTVSKEGLEWCRDEAARRACPLHVHLSETSGEVEESMKRWKMSPPVRLSKLGVLGDRTVAAHCVHLSDRDIGALAKAESSVSHLPSSNMKLSVGGRLRYPALRSSGVRVSLGTDGAASNNSLDMFLAMRDAYHLSKHEWGTTSVTAGEVLEMATVNGYRALGLDGGVIRESALADIILLDLDHHSLAPGNDRVSDIVNSATGATVRYTIVGSEIVMDDGLVKRETEIKRAAVRMACDLLGRG